MKINNILVEESFDFRNKEQGQALFSCIDELFKISDACKKSGERVLRTDNIYDKEVIEGMVLADFIYGTENSNKDEKDLLRLFIEQECTVEEPDCSCNNIYLLFYWLQEHKINFNYASNEYDWVCARRQFLKEISDKDRFVEEFQNSFRNLIFSNNIRQQLNSLSGFQALREEIVKHLAILNDSARLFFIEYGEYEAIQRINNVIWDCSVEGDAERVRRFLTFEFLNKKECLISIKCSVHTKLIRADSDARIYFSWGNSLVDSGQKILIGRIGTHPY